MIIPEVIPPDARCCAAMIMGSDLNVGFKARSKTQIRDRIELVFRQLDAAYRRICLESNT